MDEIIKAVLKRLTERQAASIRLTLYDEAIFSDELVINYQTIILQGLDYGHLQTLGNGIRVPWVRFLDKAIAYGCSVTLHLCVPICGLIKPSIVRDWPVVFRNKSGDRLYCFDERWISAVSVRGCEDNAIIVLFKGQRLTVAAYDEAVSRNILIVEGNEYYAGR